MNKSWHHSLPHKLQWSDTNCPSYSYGILNFLPVKAMAWSTLYIDAENSQHVTFFGFCHSPINMHACVLEHVTGEWQKLRFLPRNITRKLHYSCLITIVTSREIDNSIHDGQSSRRVDTTCVFVTRNSSWVWAQTDLVRFVWGKVQ